MPRTSACGSPPRAAPALTRCVRQSCGGAGAQWADNLPPLTSTRQRDALARVADAVAAARAARAARLPAELVAVDLQAALEHIGTVTGAVTNEDVLDAVFAEFCIGK